MGPRRKRFTAADLARAKAIADSVGQGSSSTPAGGTSTQIAHAHPLTDQWFAMIPKRKRLTAADRAKGISEAKALADSVGQGSSSTPAGKAPESPPEAPMPDVQEGEIDASSRVKKHDYNKSDNLSDFHTALGLWAHTTDISRAEWEALRDALKLLKDQDGRAVPDITALPSQLDTLKHRVTRRLPLTDMREAEIP